MAQNQNIVDRIRDTFLKRLDGDPSTTTITSKVASILSENEKPKAEAFIALYQSHLNKNQASEGSVQE